MSHIFISYSRKNQVYARRIADFLEEQGFNVWIDDRVDYGDRWERVIFKAIDDCAALLLLMTPEAYDSIWVEREYMYAQDVNNKPIFPVLLAGKVFPRYVVTQYVDVRDGTLPPASFVERLRRVVPSQAAKGQNVAQSVGDDLKPAPTTPTLQDLTDATRGILGEPFEWIEIPAGEFQYGHKSESDNPPQVLTLPSYAIAKYPITYSQFQKFLDDPKGFKNAQWWEGLAASTDHKKAIGDQNWKIADHPRERVSWYDAVAFCRWLSWKLTTPPFDSLPISWGGLGEGLVRLPTEQEWEKAARGTDGRKYPWGNEFDTKKANTHESGLGKTTAVTAYPQGASPYGVLDMAGNVRQWCLTEYRNKRDDDLSNSHSRVLRGGSLSHDASIARSAFRFTIDPFYRTNSFRVVSSLRLSE